MTYQVLKPGKKGARMWVAEVHDFGAAADVDQLRIEHPNGEIQLVTILHEWDDREAPAPLDLLEPPSPKG